MIVRAEGKVNASPKEIMHCYLREKTAKFIEENLEHFEIVGKNRTNLFKLNKKTSKTMIMPPISTVTNAILNQEQDGSIYQV